MPSRNFILHNFGWKLLSVLLAALTWLTIQTAFQKHEEAANQPPVVTSSSKSFMAVPLTLMTSPANTNLFRLTPESVEVEVGGDQAVLTALQSRDIQAFVDITDAQDEKQFRRPVQIRVPRNITVNSTNPTNASVERVIPTNYTPAP